ncbi:hypothetical protein CC1G_04672 [Coprinopsis cinerea okayama7|uniref:BTB domain-containing protein n=1 Tax=Coprinopsis cinerea (strain Okayama-7 / 130 / ATCC MYA-4618 / FGSC 9003) TaxID=240176 RepID=A8N4X2_COPC7|nr:hypothetical protein CC1G_04672 [Coprinopsis cinerea okayama7\|eukprot:XP_001829983.2 hypothetical protein CC1G_04672 [Coprinopsis cinerea okayama7\
MSSIPNCVKVQDESASGRTTLTPERSLTDQPTENKFYFFQNLTFRAEDELFQVPALYFLGESHFFREMFELPPPEGQPLEGSSKECPLVLEGIRAMEFQALLKVMFPRTFGKAEILSKDEWEGVLKLSDMWNMQTIKELAITNLTPILLEDPIARIVFARKYNVGRWLTPAYVDLVRRQEHIGVEDLEAIENELFQVPDLYFVKGSQFFRDMFELPTPSGQPADGSSEDRPLVLEGIRAAEFLSLLKVMYPQNFGEQERISESEWTSILKLPDMWQMSAFKKFAVESLALLLSEDPITRMALARRYGVEEWLYPSYAELVRRAQPICREDVDAIGIETALKICSLRERCVEETTKTITIYGANQGRLFANIPTTNTVQTLVLNPQRKQVGSDQITDMEQHIRDIFSPERR